MDALVQSEGQGGGRDAGKIQISLIGEDTRTARGLSCSRAAVPASLVIGSSRQLFKGWPGWVRGSDRSAELLASIQVTSPGNQVVFKGC